MATVTRQAQPAHGPWSNNDWSVTGPTAAASEEAIDAVRAYLPEVFTRTVAQARGAGVEVICTVYGMSAEAAQERARLIAVAPELLDIARAVLVDDLIPYLPAEFVAKVRAAIAKATGEQA